LPRLHVRARRGRLQARTRRATLDGIYLDSDTNYKSSNSPLLDSYRRAAGIIFQSKFSQKVVTKNFGAPAQPHVVIPNGTEIDDKTDSQEYLRVNYPQFREAFEKHPKRIVCAAEWRQSKRLGSIIVGSEVYLRNNPDACLFVLGDLDKAYAAKIKGRTPSIYFVGKVNNQDVRHFYRVSGVCVNLCIMDACPNSVIEAMAHGTPCLVTKHQGVVELMKPESGVVLDVDPWDYGPISFTTACAKIKPEIVADGIDRCMKLGRTAYRYDLSVTEMGKRYFEFLQSVARKQ
jgi:glycosyltransferase involved in cell wall biosynthesis